MFSLIAMLVWQAAASARPTTAPAPPPFGLRLTLDRRSEHVTYHFTNPSRIDTTGLVPHFFEQRYDASNRWIALSAIYPLSGHAAETTLAVAPRTTTAGSDLDTFFDPSGDVIVSGTDGDVSLGSVALTERVALARWRGWAIGVAVGYRRSRADFPPDFVILTHTMPPSTTRTFTTDRETTVSQVIDSGFAGDRAWAFADRWQLRASVTVLPLTVARLEVSLPDKTPPLETSAQAIAVGLRGQVLIERVFGPLTAGIGTTAAGTWSYQSTSAYRGRSVGAQVFVAIGR